MKMREKRITKNEYLIDREVTENEPATSWYTLKKIIDEFSDDLDDDEKQKTSKNVNEDVIHRDINANVTETNWDAKKMVIKYCPYDKDYDEKEKNQRIKTKVLYTEIL